LKLKGSGDWFDSGVSGDRNVLSRRNIYNRGAGIGEVNGLLNGKFIALLDGNAEGNAFDGDEGLADFVTDVEDENGHWALLQ
jgi:hypothetical protein